MTITEAQRALSERLRYVISQTVPTAGRFPTLETMSGIKASRWKNFFYRKQAASDDMVNFWCKKFPNDELYVRSGKLRPVGSSNRWSAPTPTRWAGQTIGDRLIWVIAEWAAPKGASLFSYLEERSEGKVTADEWAPVLMRMAEPTLAMLEVVCKARPKFTEWVITGEASGQQSVDPTSEKSTTAFQRAPGSQTPWNSTASSRAAPDDTLNTPLQTFAQELSEVEQASAPAAVHGTSAQTTKQTNEETKGDAN
ncbi:hypothetical protein PQR14_36155 [Paraburkholderia bryophila]|uniref:hypothetical protein n=1 Tax=Paraburkholderia bryophila TaxID=420952 RepID=UPI0038BD5A0A